jgi:hypothetical protein
MRRKHAARTAAAARAAALTHVRPVWTMVWLVGMARTGALDIRRFEPSQARIEGESL